jgi:hypothetical protein
MPMMMAGAGNGAAGSAAPPSAAGGRCRPGTYTGVFNGSIQLASLPVNSVTGTVRAELARVGMTENLVIQSAHVSGVDQNGNDLTVDLAGTVDCATLQLVDGRVEHGNYHPHDGTSDTMFTGEASGMYSLDPPALVGTWDCDVDDVGLVGGQGTWTITFSAQPTAP